MLALLIHRLVITTTLYLYSNSPRGQYLQFSWLVFTLQFIHLFIRKTNLKLISYLLSSQINPNWSYQNTLKKAIYFYDTNTTNRPGKSCESSSNGKFRALQSPQNSAICGKEWTEISVSSIGGAWSNPQILSSYPQSIALHPHIWILNSPSSYLKSLLSNLNSPSSILLFPSSVKSKGYLAQKVLKIVGFPTKCP